MKYFTNQMIPKLLFAVAFAVLAILPSTTQAADVGPVCIMLLKTNAGTVVAQGKSEVMLNKGDDLHIFWFSANATKAENKNGNSVPLAGRTVKSPTIKTTYSYTFSKDGDEATCSVVVHPTEGHITASTLSSLSNTPTLAGTAIGTKTVSLEIFKDGTKISLYKSGSVSVIDGDWKHKVTKTLVKGSYDLVFSGSGELKLNTISRRTLTIGTTAASDTDVSTIVVQPIPLLVGGTAKRNQTIGLLYLQVLNVGLESATITGIKVKQTGTASTDAVLSLIAIDDTELAKGQVGKVGTSPFRLGEALIPITLTLKSKETRLFTLKATMVDDVSDYVGDTLKLVVSGVNSRSDVKGTFPIKGVTWTIGN
jgi:hypothetical protein